MNIYDIADKCGVSIATVSRVLNNNPNVSAATRAKILAVMEETNYTPSALARSLGSGAEAAGFHRFQDCFTLGDLHSLAPYL